MRYQHRDGESATGAVSLTAVRDNVRVDDEGVFKVDEEREDFDDIHERLVEIGHEPLDGGGDESAGGDTETEDDAGDDVDQDGDASPRASDYTESELVEMGYRKLQSIATHYDDVDGSASADALTEALIEQRREEVDGDGA